MQVQEQTVLARQGPVILNISKYMSVIAACVLGFMMLNTVGDVVGRYFFLKPIEGTYELVGISLVIAGSLGLGFCQLNKANIRITVLFDLFPRRGQNIIYVIAYLVCAAASAGICWQGWLRGWDYIFKELGGTTVTLGLPYWPFMLLLSIGFGWVCLIFLYDVYLSFVEVLKHGTD
jgi:TRAP-type C4-dicarboxylate transport system permease small subunit